MKTPTTIAMAVLVLLFMTGAAFANHSIYHSSSKLFGDPSNTWRGVPGLSTPYGKQFRRKQTPPPAYPNLQDRSDGIFGHTPRYHEQKPPRDSIHGLSDRMFGR